MKSLEKVTAMVVLSVPYGEYDRRLVLLSREKGKITVFVRGARRPKSPFVACTQPFVFGTFYLYPGKDAYSLSEFEAGEYFDALSQRFEAAYYGFYFCEIASYAAMENERADAELLLLYQTIRALEKGQIPDELIAGIFLLRMMAASGFVPELHSCIYEGREEGSHFENGVVDLSRKEVINFSISGGGILCPSCARKKEYPGEKRRRLSSGTIYTMQYILGADLKELYAFSVNPQIQRELFQVMQDYMQHHWGHHFKSYEFLKEVLDV